MILSLVAGNEVHYQITWEVLLHARLLPGLGKAWMEEVMPASVLINPCPLYQLPHTDLTVTLNIDNQVHISQARRMTVSVHNG